jgi:redox-sensitive bicupin YhaK (pirin superfamily)
VRIETIPCLLDGDVTHREGIGNSGTIGPGDHELRTGTFVQPQRMTGEEMR